MFMPVVDDELHFPKGAKEYVLEAKRCMKEKDYLGAYDAWKKAFDEGYDLALYEIMDLFLCERIDSGKSKQETFLTCIRQYNKLFDAYLRPCDYKQIHASIGYAYQKLGDYDKAIEHFEIAEEFGYYFLHLLYWHLEDQEKTDYYSKLNKNCVRVIPDTIFFDL